MRRLASNLRDGAYGIWSPAVSQRRTGFTGSILPDLSGAGLNMSLNNMEPEDWATVAGNPALRCGGTNEYASAVVGTRFSGLIKFSMAGWMYCASTSESTAFGVLDDSSNRFEILNYLGATIYTSIGSFVYDTITKTTTGWHHYVVSYDGSLVGAQICRTFFDGRDVSSGSITSWPTSLPTFTSTGNVSIGRDVSSGYRYWAGSYSDLLVYPNRVLLASEVSELYRVGPGGWATQRRRRQYATATVAPPSTTSYVIGGGCASASGVI